jgi:hypothetical protein
MAAREGIDSTVGQDGRGCTRGAVGEAVMSDPITDFFAELDRSANEDDGLDWIFDQVDQMMHDGRWADLDAILQRVPMTYSTTYLTGFLCITFVGAPHLPSRPALYAAVRAEVIKREDAAKAERLLYGLEWP